MALLQLFSLNINRFPNTEHPNQTKESFWNDLAKIAIKGCVVLADVFRRIRI